MQLLARYWFEFELSGEDLRRFGYFPAYGVGITAYDYQDACVKMTWAFLFLGEVYGAARAF